MADVHVTTTSEAGYEAQSTVGGQEIEIDGSSEDAPSPAEILVTSYTSCFIAAFRLGARRNGVRNLGRIAVEANAEQGSDGLESISFTLRVETNLDEPESVVETAWKYCHVNSSLEESLRADVTVEDDAF